MAWKDDFSNCCRLEWRDDFDCLINYVAKKGCVNFVFLGIGHNQPKQEYYDDIISLKTILKENIEGVIVFNSRLFLILNHNGDIMLLE